MKILTGRHGSPPWHKPDGFKQVLDGAMIGASDGLHYNHKHAAVFIDCGGTLARDIRFSNDHAEIELPRDARIAIIRLNQSG